MSKNILIFCGHPDKDSFALSLAQKYYEGAKSKTDKIKLYNLAELDFDLNLTRDKKYGQPVEPILQQIQAEILQADHLVFVYPNWWAIFPAILKGFIDRIFTKGYAYDFIGNNPIRKPLLTGKTARIIVTMDSPIWYYKWFLGAPGHKAMKKAILGYCGIKPVKFTNLSPMKNTSDERRNSYLEKVYKLGQNLS